MRFFLLSHTHTRTSVGSCDCGLSGLHASTSNLKPTALDLITPQCRVVCVVFFETLIFSVYLQPFHKSCQFAGREPAPKRAVTLSVDKPKNVSKPGNTV